MASALHDLMRRFAIYTEGEQVVMDLETQLAQFLAGESVDALRLRRLLYEMVGALSPPRMKSSPMENTVPLDNLAAERLKETALIQRRVREVLIKALSLWSKTLKLEDLQIEPILGHLQQTIEHFERRHLDVRHARAGGQWQRLKAAIGLPQAQAEPSSSPSSDPKLAAALGEDGATSARGPASDRAASHLQFVRGVAETGSAEEVFEGQGVGRGPPLLAAAEGSARVAQPQAWERAQIPGSGEAPPRQQNTNGVSEATTRGCGSQDVDRRFYRKGLPEESQAKVVSGKYQPNSRIQNLPHVEFRPTEPIVLRCSHCHHEVTSCWYFAHPKSSRVAVIVPNRGHAACTRLKGRVVSYKAVCGTPSKSDVFSIMDFCTHHILRRRCANCGGEDLCEHSKRRDSCTVCRVVRRRKQ